MGLYDDAKMIIDTAIASAMPESAVGKALADIDFQGRRIHLAAIGKAAWQMADAACRTLGGAVADGAVITKYGHSRGAIANLHIFEAGHPVPDENTYAATRCVIDSVRPLGSGDAVLFLVSGGGSALFESPAIPVEEYESVTKQLLNSGADIVEINSVRKRLSQVKGGRFARLCSPARVYSLILSDVLGDDIGSVASGPAYPDSSDAGAAAAVKEKYGLVMSAQAEKLLKSEPITELDNVETVVMGSVRQLCAAAEKKCRLLGYEPVVLTDALDCAAAEAGRFMADIAKTNRKTGRALAYIAGGETVVKVTGHGLGGRNQELALAAAEGISGLENTAVFSVGSDGTDGPTDAAGGYVDWHSAERLRAAGVDISAALRDNDSYHALDKVGGLIRTGPTGTNVNDLSVLLLGECAGKQ